MISLNVIVTGVYMTVFWLLIEQRVFEYIPYKYISIVDSI